MTNCLENAENTVNVLCVPTNQSQEVRHNNNNNNNNNDNKQMKRKRWTDAAAAAAFVDERGVWAMSAAAADENDETAQKYAKRSGGSMQIQWTWLEAVSVVKGRGVGVRSELLLGLRLVALLAACIYEHKKLAPAHLPHLHTQSNTFTVPLCVCMCVYVWGSV